jgi:hypothetical protein
MICLILFFHLSIGVTPAITEFRSSLIISKKLASATKRVQMKNEIYYHDGMDQQNKLATVYDLTPFDS